MKESKNAMNQQKKDNFSNSKFSPPSDNHSSPKTDFTIYMKSDNGSNEDLLNFNTIEKQNKQIPFFNQPDSKNKPLHTRGQSDTPYSQLLGIKKINPAG